MKSRRAFVLTGLGTLLSVGNLHQDAFASQPSISNPLSEGVRDWPLGLPDSQGIANSAMDKILDAGESLGVMRSLLVVRNGTLIAERYYGGAAVSDLLAVNSVTKSVASILVGLALGQGKITSLSNPVSMLLPEEAAKLQTSPANSVTLDQILTGTSGLVYDYRTQIRLLANAPDPVRFAQGLPCEPHTPAAWAYNDAAVSLISPILERAVGMPVDEFANRHLFSRLGIEHFDWTRDKVGRCMSYMGLKLRTRDLAKIAWSMANGGQWGGVQVIPVGWVDNSTRPRVSASWQVAPISDTGYGYLWFTGNLNGRQVAWAWGYGAQFAMIVPSLHLAIVTSATDPRPQNLPRQNASVMNLVARVIELAS